MPKSGKHRVNTIDSFFRVRPSSQNIREGENISFLEDGKLIKQEKRNGVVYEQIYVEQNTSEKQRSAAATGDVTNLIVQGSSTSGADITGITAGTGLTGGGASGNISLAIDSTVATLTGTQTLTNKTLTAPTFTGTAQGASLTLTGDLTVQGDTTTLNTATLQVEDKNIVLNYHASNDTSSSAEGAGITIQDAVDASTDATILWDQVPGEFDFSHSINVTGNISVSGTVDGVDIASRDHDEVSLSGSLDYLTISGQTITRNAINLGTDVTSQLPLSNGGTGATNAITARENLGLEIGLDVQAYDLGLLSIAGLTTAANKMIYTTASDTYAVTDLTSTARALLDDTSTTAMRTTLGVDAAGTDNSTDVTIAAGKDYITINESTQVITLGTIDIGDDTNLVGGTGITLTGDTLSTTDSEIVHDNLSGYVENEHKDHSAINITAGAGLSGGGDITASRQLALDINSLGSSPQVVRNGSEEIAVWDPDYNTSSGQTAKITLDDVSDYVQAINFTGTTDGVMTRNANGTLTAESGLTYNGTLLHISKDVETTGTTGTTLLKLTNDVGTDLSQQKTFVDFAFLDDNSNETPQVRIGAEVGQNGDANSQLKEGSGAFVVYTNNADTTSGDAGASLAERMRVDYQGRVGIGTSTPSYKLDVAGIIRTTGEIYLDAGGDSIAFMGVSDANYRKALYSTNDDHYLTNRHTGGDLILMSNNGSGGGETERLRFVAGSGTQNAYFSNVNLGIGTNSPESKLMIVDSGETIIRLYASTASTRSGIWFTNGSYSYGTNIGTDNKFHITGNINSESELVTVDSSGNVGIGVTSPDSPIHIGNNVATSAGFDSFADYQILLYDTGTSSTSYGMGIRGGTMMFNSDDDYEWRYDNSAVMFLDGSAGRLGIGTTLPAYKIHLEQAGGVMQQLKATDSNQAYMKFVNSTTGDGQFTDGFLFGLDSDETVAIWNYEATAMRFATSGTERVRIASNGNMIVGSDYTTNASTKLVVSHSGANGILLNQDSSNTNNSGRLFFEGTSTSAIFQEGSDLSFRINATTGSSSGTERVVIREDGMFISSASLGVGTAPNSNNGRIYASSHVVAGKGSGGVAMTQNDGGGNANLCFNHESRVPEQNGNSGRIHVNTDATSNATMAFELKSNVTSGSSIATDDIFNIRADKKMVIGTTTFTSPVTLKVNKDNGTYTSWESIAGFQSKRSADSENEAGIFINSLGDALGGQISSNWYWDNNSGTRGNTGRSAGIFGIANSTTTNSEFYWQTTPHNSNTVTTRMELDGASSTLHVDGDVVAYSTTVSDKRLKDNVETIDNGLDKIMQLRGVEFDWNATSRKGQHDIGLIAQEVEEVIPEIVREKEFKVGEFTNNKKTFKTIDYEKLVGVLIEAVKELKTEIEELKNG